MNQKIAEVDWKFTAEARMELVTEMRRIIADLTDPDECWFDHHGYCQAHMWFETEPKCPHARAKALLSDGNRP